MLISSKAVVTVFFCALHFFSTISRWQHIMNDEVLHFTM